MSDITSESEAQGVYERWGPSILTYCRLFLGDQEAAEAATQGSFVAFLRTSPQPSGAGIPLALLRAALMATKNRCSLRGPRCPVSDELEDVLPLLSCEERAVFILRGVLELQAGEVAAVTGTTSEAVNRLWFHSLLHLRQLWLGKKDECKDQE